MRITHTHINTRRSKLYLPHFQCEGTKAKRFPLLLQVTSAASDPELGFTLISCFISPNSNPSVASGYALIETVCPTDDSVQFYAPRDFPAPRAPSEKKTFSFTFDSKFNMSLLFLHCEMSLCSRRPRSNQRLPACLQPSETCDSLSVDNILAMMMNSKTSTKPLVVVDGPDRSEETGQQKKHRLHFLRSRTTSSTCTWVF
ncbi:Transforming growth factor beta receptor type 3 [Liparis tanakae]|uniref:Transforming growth factor beta receptor type 3 n=1 Tax=Liparis tanakae TaxID=230148 RepID=A0A4Z2E3R6_9TELE|nr:Transforming growth factor beta receptor type 3 [Liparis tanakae]